MSISPSPMYTGEIIPTGQYGVNPYAEDFRQAFQGCAEQMGGRLGALESQAAYCENAMVQLQNASQMLVAGREEDRSFVLGQLTNMKMSVDESVAYLRQKAQESEGVVAMVRNQESLSKAYINEVASILWKAQTDAMLANMSTQQATATSTLAANQRMYDAIGEVQATANAGLSSIRSEHVSMKASVESNAQGLDTTRASLSAMSSRMEESRRVVEQVCVDQRGIQNGLSQLEGKLKNMERSILSQVEERRAISRENAKAEAQRQIQESSMAMSRVVSDSTLRMQEKLDILAESESRKRETDTRHLEEDIARGAKLMETKFDKFMEEVERANEARRKAEKDAKRDRESAKGENEARQRAIEDWQRSAERGFEEVSGQVTAFGAELKGLSKLLRSLEGRMNATEADVKTLYAGNAELVSKVSDLGLKMGAGFSDMKSEIRASMMELVRVSQATNPSPEPNPIVAPQSTYSTTSYPQPSNAGTLPVLPQPVPLVSDLPRQSLRRTAEYVAPAPAVTPEYRNEFIHSRISEKPPRDDNDFPAFLSSLRSVMHDHEKIHSLAKHKAEARDAGWINTQEFSVLALGSTAEVEEVVMLPFPYAFPIDHKVGGDSKCLKFVELVKSVAVKFAALEVDPVLREEHRARLVRRFERHQLGEEHNQWVRSQHPQHIAEWYVALLDLEDPKKDEKTLLKDAQESLRFFQRASMITSRRKFKDFVEEGCITNSGTDCRVMIRSSPKSYRPFPLN